MATYPFYDLVIIGAGINGAGIAADAAERGLSVLLCDKGDIGGETSSHSTKLIHGGLRYLEQYHFSLVQKALKERDTLSHIAPHLTHAIPLFIPKSPYTRPDLLMHFGLFLYDHLSRHNTLPRSHAYYRKTSTLPYFHSLKAEIQKGFVFYDLQTNDTRLTLHNALQAKQYGACIKPHFSFDGATVKQGYWVIKLLSSTGTPFYCHAKALVNATGPRACDIDYKLNIKSACTLALIKGSHLIVPKLYEGTQGYMLAHQDKRFIFVLPYQGYTLIGTTEIPLATMPETLSVTLEETRYLCDIVNAYFNTTIQPQDIIHQFAGVRPLATPRKSSRSPRELSRDYWLHLYREPAPLLTVYGGKLTTYRQLAETALDTLREIFPHLPSTKTKRLCLPGSEKIPPHSVYPWLEPNLYTRYINTYGSRIETLLHGKHCMEDLGVFFGHGLYQHEVDFLIKEEWATTAEDILWRRTFLGLQFTATEIDTLTAYTQLNNRYTP